MPPDAPFGASEHGSCHRPACPLSHDEQAQSREARVFAARLSAGSSVDVSPVEGVLSTTPTGGMPNHLQFSALSYRRDDPGGITTRHGLKVVGFTPGLKAETLSLIQVTHVTIHENIFYSMNHQEMIPRVR
jgi:hypothetical protein